jgi:hypothetical protein
MDMRKCYVQVATRDCLLPVLYNICQSRKQSGQGNPRMGCVKSLASVTLQKLNELICEKHTTYKHVQNVLRYNIKFHGESLCINAA